MEQVKYILYSQQNIKMVTGQGCLILPKKRPQVKKKKTLRNRVTLIVRNHDNCNRQTYNYSETKSTRKLNIALFHPSLEWFHLLFIMHIATYSNTPNEPK